MPINCRRVWTEADWSPRTWEDGVNGHIGVAYSVSKKFAEKAAWEFMDNEKPHFDLIALNAPGVFGFDLEGRDDLTVVRQLNDLLRYRRFEEAVLSFSRFLLIRISSRCL
jgi:nucleoside-diphosphate-sugar epimerase